MDTITQLKNLIDETEFSDAVKDKVKELSVKAKLRQESGAGEADCLTSEEKEELAQLVKADMVLDVLELNGYKDYLSEVDKLLASLKK